MAKFKKTKEEMTCNQPVASWRPGKKKAVKACEGGKEKIVHFGDSEYKSNYSDSARKNFRSRHNCDSPGSKLGARYWSCQALWKSDSPKYTSGKKGGNK